MLDRTCLQCGKEFKAHKCQVKRGGGKYCSISCGTTYRNIHNNPAKDPEVRKKISQNHAPVPWLIENRYDNYKGIDIQNYRKKAFRFYGKRCNRCGSEERIEVHHKDRDRKNNDLNNLEVLCKSCHVSEHLEELKNQNNRCPKTGRFMKKGSDVIV